MDTIFVGKERQYDRRFLQMCSHHLVDPVACAPASGWDGFHALPASVSKTCLVRFDNNKY